MQTLHGMRLNALLDQVKVKSEATKLVFTAADGFTAEVSLADARKCSDCLVAFADGMLSTVMPGMPSNVWVKDVLKIEAK